MKAREDISISQIFNRLDNFNISSGRTLENTSRPISAIIKRPDSKTKLNGNLLIFIMISKLIT